MNQQPPGLRITITCTHQKIGQSEEKYSNFHSNHNHHVRSMRKGSTQPQLILHNGGKIMLIHDGAERPAIPGQGPFQATYSHVYMHSSATRDPVAQW